MRQFIKIDTYCGLKLVNIDTIQHVEPYRECEAVIVFDTFDYDLDDKGRRYYAQNRIVVKEHFATLCRKIRKAAR